ncbi:MAG: HlyD family secretion protein [Rhodobacteraceae bacterium]|jgi:membrane fusion protein|nr:HlyD family secretion protein [Paracoccaceae bacterium]
MTLFRREVLERQSARLEGDVFVGVPVTWQMLGLFLGTSVVAAVVFLASASFPRVEIARGVIQPDLGVAVILPPTTGTASVVHVSNGEAVAAGQTLVTAEAENFLASGQGAASRIIDALRRQTASVDAQITAAREDAAAERRRLDAQIAGLEDEAASLAQQIALQEDRIAAAAADVEAVRLAVERGAITRRDLAEREEALAERRQQLAQLQQARSNRLSTREEALRSRERLTANASERLAQLEAQREEIAQSIAATEQSRAFVLRAPVSGTVANLSVNVGTQLTPERQVAAIIPEGSTLQAHLRVPSGAIGFVAEGQEVSLAIDTFPFERFGTIPGQVVDVARTAEPAADGSLTYDVRASLARDHMLAFGVDQPLVAGMTLTARIVTGRQSLVEWLFEPLFALGRR